MSKTTFIIKDGESIEAIKLEGDEIFQKPLPEGCERLKYTVKEGETAFDIAHKFEVNPYELWTFLTEKYGSDSLYTGQEIEIPHILIKKELPKPNEQKEDSQG
ncbi:MAG: LysM domain-containing protein [Candidatus Omnitrophica bacterium]|nr:LysM domain-containing protein [Candidatus Omnitrophota bacterium]